MDIRISGRTSHTPQDGDELRRKPRDVYVPRPLRLARRQRIQWSELPLAEEDGGGANDMKVSQTVW